MIDVKIEKNEKELFVIGILCCLIARGASLYSLTFSIDDLFLWPLDFNFENAGIIAFRDGRFTGPLLAWFEDALGINASHAFTLSAVSLMIAQVVSAILVCRLWRITNDIWLSGIVVAILVLHPYQADLSTWKIAQLNGGLPFVMILFALLLVRQSTKYSLISILIVVLALGIHQIPLQFAATVLILVIPFSVLRGSNEWKEWWRMTIMLVLATGLYWIIAKLVILYTAHEASQGRDNIILFSHPSLVIDRIIELFTMFATRDPLVTGWARVLLVITAMTGMVAIFLKSKVRFLSAMYCVSGLLVCVGLALITAIALTILPYAWVPIFRNLLSVSVVWAAIAGMAYVAAGSHLRKVVITCTSLICLAFIGVNNEILTDQQRVNQRDVAMMNRIAADLESFPEYHRIKRFLFIGTNPAPISLLRTAADLSTGWNNYGTTLSVFAVPWPGYLAKLYQEVRGTPASFFADQEEIELGNRICATKTWPERGSISVRIDLAFICISPPKAVRSGPFEPVVSSGS